MAYALIIGSKDTAQHQADFEAAVENAGGPTACIGGVAIHGDVCVQAVNASVNPAEVQSVARRTKPRRKKRKTILRGKLITIPREAIE